MLCPGSFIPPCDQVADFSSMASKPGLGLQWFQNLKKQALLIFINKSLYSAQHECSAIPINIRCFFQILQIWVSCPLTVNGKTWEKMLTCFLKQHVDQWMYSVPKLSFKVWLLNWLSFFVVGESKSVLKDVSYYPHYKIFHLPSYFSCLKNWTFSDSRTKSFSSLFIPFFFVYVCVLYSWEAAMTRTDWLLRISTLFLWRHFSIPRIKGLNN